MTIGTRRPLFGVPPDWDPAATARALYALSACAQPAPSSSSGGAAPGQKRYPARSIVSARAGGQPPAPRGRPAHRTRGHFLSPLDLVESAHDHAVRSARRAESFCVRVGFRLSVWRIWWSPSHCEKGVCPGAARPGSGDSGRFVTASSGWLDAEAIACPILDFVAAHDLVANGAGR
jgi:hypothetical protein